MKYLGPIVVALFVGIPAACSGPAPKARPVPPAVTRDIPSALKGTILAEASLRKAEPVLVSGYGLVVGLNGTGGGDLDARIAASMERELGLMQATRGSDLFVGTPLEGKSPQEVLRSREVAVVVVYGAVIPGAPGGAIFDVYVRAASNAPDLSLEGGTLWTTELQIGGPARVGGVQTRKIASAHGPVFINPFAEPGSDRGVTRRDGRILGGGLVTAPLDLELVLDNESYTRAKSMTDAINNRFPPGPGEPVVARGRSSRLITVSVPSAFRERSQEFLQVLLHIQIDPGQSHEYARRYVEALKTQPYLGDDLSWALQALPQRAALPFLRDMYDWPEQVPRLAALRAGAGLGDAMAAPALKDLALLAPTTNIRADAIRLLGRLNAGPTVDTALREQLHSDSDLVRVAAYEALVDRAETVQLRRWLEQQAALPANVRAEGSVGDPRVILELSGNTIQGVSRKVVAGRFLLDIVPEGTPMIYVSQQGRPRIVLFGEHLEIQRPVTVSAWEGPGEASLGGEQGLPRLLLAADAADARPRLLYRYPDRIEDGTVLRGKTVRAEVPADLVGFIQFLAHTPTPEEPMTGLGLTYSEVVGVLHAIQREGGFGKTALGVEDDLLKARLLQAASSVTVAERPETSKDKTEVRIYEAPKAPAGAPAPGPAEKPSLVEPLPQPKKKP